MSSRECFDRVRGHHRGEDHDHLLPWPAVTGAARAELDITHTHSSTFMSSSNATSSLSAEGGGNHRRC